MFKYVFQKSVRVPGVREFKHITHVSTDRVWICDYRGNLILTNTTGDTLDHVTDLSVSGYGVHTVSRDSAFIYIDSHHNIIKLSTKKVKTTVIPYNTSPWRPLCVYSSPSTGDLLVGTYNTDTDTGQVNRYTNTGEHIQTIQHDNTGQGLYSKPIFITENRNGDVIVSDFWRGAVVVTDRRGRHRFSYTGPPSGSLLQPRGICTDALSHILLCEYNIHTVHMIDQNGLFLTQFEREQHGIFTPWSLSYDCDTQLLWVGSFTNNTVNIYRLINEGDNLTDKVDELKMFLRKEKTTVSHARGILVGCAEAGKTTLLKRLRGQSQNAGEVTESTRGLEVHQHLFIVKDGILEVADDDSPLKTFIRINATDVKPNMSGAVDLSNPIENKDNLEPKGPDKERGETILYSREEEKVELSSPPTKRKKVENSVEVMARDLSSEAQKMVKDEIFQKILSEKENLPTVSMLDFAGQLAYYACHQIYVTPKAFFILVLDMTKKFEDLVNKEKDNQEGSIFSVWTYKDYLKFWITSIKTFGGTKAPLFIIVTHTEGKSTEEVQNYFEDFWNAVPDEDRGWLSESLKDRDYA
ncbi:uncharacterized protein LOC134278269, partial [Saccostrea cucullata]|uniref:uncharacterized protein LOC134278269 n=1 Tax=Saccostrea cuccullata TaxID=36930 RepID=UPI002ED17A61